MEWRVSPTTDELGTHWGKSQATGEWYSRTGRVLAAGPHWTAKRDAWCPLVLWSL